METRILIVDADQTVLALLDRVLSGDGVEVLCARTVDEARTMVRDADPPDVVVAAADLKTPHGERFLDRVRDLWGFGVHRVWLADDPAQVQGQFDASWDAGLRRPLFDAELIRRTILPAQDKQATSSPGALRDSWLADHITDGILLGDAAGRITLVNRAAAGLLNLDLHATVGARMEEADLPEELTRACQEVLASGEAITRSFPLTGCNRVVRITCAMNDDREDAGTYTVMRDVTADVRATELRNHYLNVVSHELRTPLTALSNFVSLWYRHPDEPVKGDRDKLIEGIRQQSMRLAHQIDKLILLARLEQEDPGVEPEVFEVQAALEEAIESCRVRAELQGTGFRVEVPDGTAYARGDREDFRRAVFELTENAVKFTPPGGEVMVRATPGDDGYMQVEVEDTGIGIDPADHGAIFDAFRQLEQPLTRTYGGAGLGLALARRIVEPWQGTLEVESSVGKGATFRLRIPAAKPDVANPALTVSGSPGDGHGS